MNPFKVNQASLVIQASVAFLATQAFQVRMDKVDIQVTAVFQAIAALVALAVILDLVYQDSLDIQESKVLAVLAASLASLAIAELMVNLASQVSADILE